MKRLGYALLCFALMVVLLIAAQIMILLYGDIPDHPWWRAAIVATTLIIGHWFYLLWDKVLGG